MLATLFPVRILSVPPAERRDEQLGTKAKFWFDDGAGKTLFKRGRPNEDWSEKIASECAGLLGLPHAQVELATCDSVAGIVSPSFLEGADNLIHGNELLLALDSSYPQGERYHVRQHTIDAIFAAFTKFRVEAPFIAAAVSPLDAADVFAGYLLLDAWIGNSDRHHENWGVIQHEGRYSVAPTYNHASSMGRNTPPEEVSLRLRGPDPGMSVAVYASRCRSALYASNSAARPMKTADAAKQALAMRPGAAHWLEQLRSVDDARIRELFERVPSSYITEDQRKFSAEILGINRVHLLTEVR